MNVNSSYKLLLDQLSRMTEQNTYLRCENTNLKNKNNLLKKENKLLKAQLKPSVKIPVKKEKYNIYDDFFIGIF